MLSLSKRGIKIWRKRKECYEIWPQYHYIKTQLVCSCNLKTPFRRKCWLGRQLTAAISFEDFSTATFVRCSLTSNNLETSGEMEN